MPNINEINNIPDYAMEYRWWVVRFIDKEYWFWGAWNDYAKALEVSMNLEESTIFENNYFTQES